MGFGIPQVITESKASGAQVIDGSLKFDSTKSTHLSKSFPIAGNRSTWTLSCWVKKHTLDASGSYSIYGAYNDSNNRDFIGFEDNQVRMQFRIGGSFKIAETEAKLRDPSAWAHYLFVWDLTESTDSDRAKIYINGERQSVTNGGHGWPASDSFSTINNNKIQYIGATSTSGTATFFNQASTTNLYFIDGLALGPGYFGFTDPLTNTWRPKKYTGVFNGSASGTIYSNTVTMNGGAAGYGTPASMFDGDETDTGRLISAANGNITWDASSYNLSGTLRVRTQRYRKVTVAHSGGSTTLQATSSTALHWLDFGNLTNITSVVGFADSDGVNTGVIAAVEYAGSTLVDGTPAGVNGFYLPMDGNSPIGHDLSKPNPLNDGTTWSSFGNNTNINNTYPWSNAFDGQATGAYQQGAGATDGAGYARWTPTGGINVNSSLRINTDNGNNSDVNVKFSGSNAVSYSSLSDGWNSISGTGTLEYIEFANSGNTWSYLCAVEIDGVVLVDNVYGNGWKPVNFGGSVSLDNPIVSGALPILNTTQGGTQAGVGVRTDANYQHLVLALPLVGNVNDVSNSINSTSTTKTVTPSGATATTTAKSQYYGSSVYFDGTSDEKLSIANNTDFDFGTGDFTVEFWTYLTVIESTAFIGKFVNGNYAWIIQLVNATTLRFYAGNNGSIGNYHDFTVGAFSVNDWHHVALTRSGSTVTMYLDGISIGTASNSQNLTSSTSLVIGTNADSTDQTVNGYMSDLRIYKGVAKYTSDFVVASTSPDILPDTPSGVSGGSKLAKIIDGAVAFDGTGDQLEVTGPGTLAASSNWCAECYVYCNGVSDGTFRIISAKESVNGSEYWMIRYRLGNITFNSGNNYKDDVPNIMNRWAHLAMTKSGNTVRGFVDGKKVWENTSDSSSTNITTLVIGGGYGSENWPGFISNARFVNGSSVYTADFTPPTLPLTNITNTYLLCCQSNKKAYVASVAPGTTLNDGTVWSSNGGGNLADVSSWTNAFNGRVPTNNSSYSDVVACEGGQTSTVTFSPAISGNIRVFISSSASSGTINGSVSLSDSSSVSANVYPNAATFKDFGSKSNITSLTLNAGSNGGVRLSAIEVNGFLLIDGYSGKSVTVNGNAAANNFNPFNTDINTVRGQETGYCTFNPLSGNNTLSNGNLNSTGNQTAWRGNSATIGVSSGKWYFESRVLSTNSGNIYADWGIVLDTNANWGGQTVGDYGISYYGRLGKKEKNNSSVDTTSSGVATGDVVQVAFDLDNGKIWFGVNNIWIDSGNPSAGSNEAYTVESGTWLPAVAMYDNGTVSTNFGQKPFKFPPPDGFQPLNAANIRPENVIVRPDQYIGAVIYTGNQTARTLSTNFAPDFVWTKRRDDSNSHQLYNSVRGDNKILQTDNANDEETVSNSLSFSESKGINIGSGTRSNENSVSYVAWAWKAGGNKGVFNVDGEGFANASDAGMNIGGQNSNAYNQTTLWRNSTTTTDIATNTGNDINSVFDGRLDTGTRAASNGGTGVLQWSNGTIQGKVRVYLSISSNSGLTYVVGGTTTTISSAPTGWYDLGNGDLTELRFTYNNSGITFVNAIEVDGKILVDSDVTPPNLPSIAATGCSVGTKQGFSIVTYQGTTSNETIPHALGSVPAFYICKAFGSSGYTDSWNVYHQSLGNSAYLKLQSSDGATTGSTIWEGKSPNTSVFYVASNSNANENGVGYVSYIWADVPGLQKFGKYVNNASADGPFIELGFKPAIVLIKCLSNGTNWRIADNVRDPFNNGSTTNWLRPSTSGAESSERAVDFVSNGFKIRSTAGGDINQNSNAGSVSYIYAAWAESPSINLFGGQSNAR